MQNNEFFREIEHRPMPWGKRTICVPVFYYDCLALDAIYLVRKERLQALLPSPRMHPFRASPWHSPIVISCYKFRDSDIGPYNEVSISIPFTLDRSSPHFTGSLRKTPAEPYVFVHHLPVTTEIALDAGVEFAGYPKFLAAIEFERHDGTLSCRLSKDDQHILTLEGRMLDLNETPRSRRHPFTIRNQRLLRSETITNQRMSGSSTHSTDVRLTLGKHPIAEELKRLELGRLVAYQYSPAYQLILTPVVESFAC